MARLGHAGMGSGTSVLSRPPRSEPTGSAARGVGLSTDGETRDLHTDRIETLLRARRLRPAAGQSQWVKPCVRPPTAAEQCNGKEEPHEGLLDHRPDGGGPRPARPRVLAA